MKYDAILVLAGGIKDNGELPESTRKRVQTAKTLYKQGLSDHVIMSGKWSQSRLKAPALTEAEAMSRYALQLGIPPKALFKEESSGNTKENVVFTVKTLLQPNQWKRVLVVTSDFHIPRVKFLFQKIVDSDSDIYFIGTETNFHFLTWIRWQISEKIVFNFRKYFTRYHE